MCQSLFSLNKFRQFDVQGWCELEMENGMLIMIIGAGSLPQIHPKCQKLPKTKNIKSIQKSRNKNNQHYSPKKTMASVPSKSHPWRAVQHLQRQRGPPLPRRQRGQRRRDEPRGAAPRRGPPAPPRRQRDFPLRLGAQETLEEPETNG